MKKMLKDKEILQFIVLKVKFLIKNFLIPCFFHQGTINFLKNIYNIKKMDIDNKFKILFNFR